MRHGNGIKLGIWELSGLTSIGTLLSTVCIDMNLSVLDSGYVKDWLFVC